MASEKHGKVAFVTGASSGIGLATAEALVKRGYATVLTDRNEDAGRKAEAQLREFGACAFISCDVTDERAVKAHLLVVSQAIAQRCLHLVEELRLLFEVVWEFGNGLEGRLHFRRVSRVDRLGAGDLFLFLRSSRRCCTEQAEPGDSEGNREEHHPKTTSRHDHSSLRVEIRLVRSE